MQAGARKYYVLIDQYLAVHVGACMKVATLFVPLHSVFHTVSNNLVIFRCTLPVVSVLLMAAYQLLTVKTAFPKNSIWRDVSLGSFRRNVASLKQASEAVGDKKVHTRDSTDDTRRLDACYTLPFETEKIFVNHLAFIAAIEKSARRVTAVSLEESPDSVTVRLASNGAVHPMVEETLRAILDLLSGCANRSTYITAYTWAL